MSSPLGRKPRQELDREDRSWLLPSARLPRLAEPREKLAIRGVVVLGLGQDDTGYQTLGLAGLLVLGVPSWLDLDRDRVGPSPAVLRPLGPGLKHGVVILDHLLAGQFLGVEGGG